MKPSTIIKYGACFVFGAFMAEIGFPLTEAEFWIGVSIFAIHGIASAEAAKL